MDINSGEFFAVRAGATVIATGGMHNCYTFTSGTTGLCGEGQAAAIRAGAEMTLMEMVTFCPGVITYPPIFRGSIFPYILSCHGYMELFNSDGEQFLEKHIPASAMDVALYSEWNKMLQCYAMYQEVNVEKKGDAYGGVLFSLNHLSEEMKQKFEKTHAHVRQGATKPMMEFHDKYGGIPVYGAAHYFDGGIAVNEKMESCLDGLFAAGECTGGNFGANRVAAATTQMLVQGLEAGKNAALYAKVSGLKEIDTASLDRIEAELMAPFSNKDAEDSGKVRAAVQKTVSENANIVVCQEGLEKGLKDVLALKDIPVSLATDFKEYNRGMIDWLEVRSMVLCAEGIFKSSLARKESRGVFIRSDMMFTDDDNWLVSTRYKNGDVWLEPVEQGKIAAPGGIHDYIANIEAVVARLSY